MSAPGHGSALVEAAAALEDELRRFEALADEALRLPLRSRKNLERTTERLRELGAAEERLGARLQALTATIGALGERQRGRAEALQARVADVQARHAALEALLEQFRALGGRAQELNAAAQAAAETSAQAGSRDAVVGNLLEVRRRIDELAAEATRLTERSLEDGFEDVSREADSMRQALLAIRNRLGLLAQA